MRSISKSIKRILAEDEFMKICCFPTCKSNQVQYHHTYIYSGRQLNDPCFIVPSCKLHHDNVRTDKYTKDYFKWVALIRANIKKIQKKYPKFDWKKEKERLDDIFLKEDDQ